MSVKLNEPKTVVGFGFGVPEGVTCDYPGGVTAQEEQGTPGRRVILQDTENGHQVALQA